MKKLVDYLNTLHKVGGNNGNATAESNYNTKYATEIIAPDEALIDSIKDALNKNHRVLITGYAGDGKTTLARQIAGKSLISPREVIQRPSAERPLVVIKDLSEISTSENDSIYNDLVNDNIDLLIVSNTGTIRSRLNDIYDRLREKNDLTLSRVEYETAILGGIECEDSDNGLIKLTPTIHIKTFNLVKRDNLKLARNIFVNILEHKEWADASEEEKKSIPYINRELLMADNYRALDRMMMLYRRIYEYGDRLTIRNLLEHFTYTLTGNSTSRSFFSKNSLDKIFFENFFSPEAINVGMTGAVLVDRPHFGYNLNSAWKRRIWLEADAEEYTLSFNEKWLSAFYSDNLRKLNTKNSAYQLRLKIYRMIFFMNNDGKGWSTFICSFLNSPGFNYFWQIQNNAKISNFDSDYLTIKIRHVVKEYFLGMKLPESSNYSSEDNVYIAMSRNSTSIRQTAQVILQEFEWDSDCLQVESDVRGIQQFYFEFGKGLRLYLPLPFLDYLLNCHLGAMDDPAFASFRKRLDNLKDKVLQLPSKNASSTMRIAYLDLKRELNTIKYVNEDTGRIFVTEGR